jgi:hypothetical protein
MDIKDMVGMLAARAPALARELLPAGRKDGAEWRVGSLAGEPGQSLAVHIGAGARAGVWCDFSSGERGDALDLVAAVAFAGDKRQACAWARRWLGIDAADPRQLAQQRRAVADRHEAETRDHDRGRRRAAQARWLNGTPIDGTPADAYLAGRGIGTAQLGRAPRALRYVAQEWNDEARMHLPCMVAAIVGADGTHLATHRTWLEPDHAGSWRKASLKAPKKVLAGFVGGTINLWRGKSGQPLRSAPDGDVVALAEGIEDALTVAVACPDWRVLAAVSVSNLASVTLPATVTEVVLVLQRDGENEQVKRARDKAERRFLEEGRAVKRALPPEGHKDFNDWWRAQRAGVAA